ncbi:MAG: hypothetical protein J6C11_06965, partial [Spirochaetaceae bacterium]|nr:hypothetical protein [Spirochaetaceae bacterium]
ERENYTFSGWSEDKAADAATYTDKAMFTATKDTSLYAVWEANVTIAIEGSTATITIPDDAKDTRVQHAVTEALAGNATLLMINDQLTDAQQTAIATALTGKSDIALVMGGVTAPTTTITELAAIDLAYKNGTGENAYAVASDGTHIITGKDGLDAWNTAATSDVSTNLTLACDIEYNANWSRLEVTYNGTINGDGHTITGLHINNNSDNQGFIRVLGEGGTVKNLTFADAHMTAGQYSGIVVGFSEGTIENCHVISGSLTTTGSYAGGIVGENGGKVKNCTNAATITVAQGVTGIYCFGGIVGSNAVLGTVMGCINTGAISSGNYNTGGVVGWNDGVVVACSNMEAVTGTGTTGGIVGVSAQYHTRTIGSWTIVTNESDVESDGVGAKDFGTVTGCFTGDAATINDKVSEMNAAIATYNETAAEGKTCPYTWQAGTDGYPTLVKGE